MNIEDIDAQIADLLKQKQELVSKKVEEERLAFEKAEKERIEKEQSQPVEFTITRAGTTNLSIHANILRLDYIDMIGRKVASYYNAGFNRGIMHVKDYSRWEAAVKELPNVVIHNKVPDYIEYWLHGPHAIVTMDEKVAKVKVHPDVSHYNIFMDMAGTGAARLMPDGFYHVPKNELYRLMKISYEYKAGEFQWDEESKAYALKDLEDRRLLDEIALAEDAPDFDIDLNGHRLRPFQRVGVKFAITTKKTIGDGNIRVLIADQPGLGKTWQAIATAKVAGTKKIAVVCPASVKENWRREIERLTGEFAKTMKGTQPSLTDLQDIMLSDTKWFIFNYDILARAFEDKKQNGNMVEMKERHLWIEAINTLGFDFIILDEAHKFKNTDSGRTKAILKLNVPNIMELTGTPVINRPLELYPGLSLLNKEVFNNQASFEARYSAGNYGVKNVEELRNLLRPYMIRRKKLDVQKDLPPIIRETQQYDMTEKERAVYHHLLNSILVAIDEAGEIQELGRINHILTKILRMKQFLSKIKARSVAEFAKELYDQADPDDQYKKIIIFTQFVPIVHRITKLLGSEARYIVGAEHTPLDRQLIVDEFQTNKRVQYLVATPQSTSEGLNITAAGHVIFCDYAWTPAMHEQGEGRAYGRLGDSHTVVSHYFAVQNSLDDWLRDIILQKLDTIEQVVDGVNVQRTQEESIIKELIKALKRGELR